MLSIGIAVGFLTRQTVKGTREALLISQQAFRLLDILGITGFSEPLVTIEMARSMGWTAKLKNFSLEDFGNNVIFGMYLLHKPQLIKVEERYYHQGNLLDLSMAADPVVFLKAIPDGLKKAIQRIDLSFAYLPKEEMKELVNQLRQLPELKQIIHDPDDSIAELKTPELELVSLNRRVLFPNEVPVYTYARELFITNNWSKLPPLNKKMGILSHCKATQFSPEQKQNALTKYEAAIAAHKKENYEAAIKLFHESIQLFSLSKNTELGIAKVYLALASSYRDTKQIKDAKDCLAKCNEIYDKLSLPENNPLRLAVKKKLETLPEELVLQPI